MVVGLVGLAATRAVASEWEVSVVGRLPEINAIAHAPDGRLWYLTPTGAYRTTGLDSPKQPADLAVPFFLCDHLFVARSGAVWTGFPGSHSVIRSASGNQTTVSSAHGLQDRQLQGFAQARDGQVLLATNRGVFGVQDATGVSRLEAISGTGSLDVRAMLALSDGTVLLGTTTGIHRLDGNLRVSDTKWIGTDQTADALAADNRGEIWIASGGIMAKTGHGSTRWFRVTDGLPFAVSKLAVDADHRIWLAGTAGLAVFANDRFERLGEPEGVTDEHITALLADAEHNV
jgi:ligand-binding sensor domain-containing protein